MIFFLSSLDYCANCQADSYPCSPKWLLSSVNYQHLPLKFNCPLLPAPTSSFPPKKPDSVICISWTCCRLALFASLPWTSWPCIERGRESGTLYWKHWEELKITRCLFSIQHSDKLMTFNQDYFFLVWGEFFILLWMGKCESFPYAVAVFEAMKAGNIGTFHLARASSKWSTPQPRSKNSSSSCPTEAGTTMDLQTPSLLSAAGQPRGAVLTKAVSNPPLLPCDKSANLTWPFARCFVKRRMPWNPWLLRRNKDCLLRR